MSNNCNFTPPAAGEVALLSWDDAVTLFHEFGHALHGLSSRVVYHPLSGTNTTRDHVELPSQLNEHWLETPELLQKFACHVTDGSALPMDLVKKIEAASTFAQGFGTVEFLASALVDLRMHTAPAGRCPLSSPPPTACLHICSTGVTAWRLPRYLTLFPQLYLTPFSRARRSWWFDTS